MNSTISNSGFRLNVQIICHNTTLVRKHSSSENFVLCADQECWELTFQSFDLRFKCLKVTLITTNIFSYFKSSKMLLREVIKPPKKF